MISLDTTHESKPRRESPLTNFKCTFKSRISSFYRFFLTWVSWRSRVCCLFLTFHWLLHNFKVHRESVFLTLRPISTIHTLHRGEKALGTCMLYQCFMQPTHTCQTEGHETNAPVLCNSCCHPGLLKALLANIKFI